MTAYAILKRRIFTFVKSCTPIALLSVLAYSGCNNAQEKAPDVSNINVALQTAHFDRDLYAIDTNHIGEGLKQLKAKYPDFLDFFLDTLMAYNIHGNYNDTVGGIREGLKPFLVYKDFRNLEDSIRNHFPDTKDVDEKLTKGFKYVKYYFSALKVPRVIYLNMGLSKWPAFPVDSNTFCIGLDMFLGDNFAPYAAIGISEYMLPHHRENYLPTSVFSAYYKEYYPFKPDEHTLLDLILQRGKEQYFLHKILPGTPDSVLFAFTQRQVDWCNNNEALVYNFFVKQNLFYSKESHNIMPYVTDGPFARGLEPVTDTVKVTPGNIGSWLGYRIVRSWMVQHPSVSLAAMITEGTDPAKFLEEAKYKPK